MKQLLEKYYEGQTSKQEDRQLRNLLKLYVGSDAELLEAQSMFSLYDDEAKETVNIDFDKLIEQHKSHKVRKVYFGLTTAVAASLIAFAMLFMLSNPQDQIVYAYVNGKPITDKQEAIAYSKQAMNTLSSNLNKGTSGLNYMEKLNKPADLLIVRK
ncbi:MAG: hypothetical protein CVU09_11720 [Bacteroidetes bacterium HGW-Bacteroidetes-4]|nr:MAG: hypothetical protein CVU09_11720 [Bacteroidetes bacterium HGW-Bacteroidetes-4]